MTAVTGSVFSREQQVWDWLDSLRRRRALLPIAEEVAAVELIHAAVQRVAGLRFDGKLLDRALIAEHAGLAVEELLELLGETDTA